MEGKQVSVEELKQVLVADFDQLVQAMAQAGDHAAAGRLMRQEARRMRIQNRRG